jgi:hypothetical protein
MQVNFQWILLFPSPFLLMSFSYISFFSNQAAMVLPWEQPKFSPQTELFLPTHTTTLPTTTGSGEFSCQLHFLQMFRSYVAILFQFIIYGPTMGRAKTQPTD